MSPKRLLLKFARQYPLLVSLTVVLGFAGAFFNGISVALIVPLLMSFLGQDSALRGGPAFLKKALELFDGVPEEYRTILITATIVFAIILKNASEYANAIASNLLSRKLIIAIRREAIHILLDVDIDFYAKNKVGDIVNRINMEVTRTAIAIRTSTAALSTVFVILVFVAWLLAMSWMLTLVSTALLFLVALVNQYFVARSKKYGQNLSESSRNYSSKLHEILYGIRLVKSSGTEDEEYTQIERLFLARDRSEFQSQANYSIIAPINEISGVLTFLAIVVIGRAFFAGQMENLSSILLTYLVILFRLLPYIGRLNGFRSQLSNSSPSVALVAEFLRRDDKPIMSSGSVPYKKLTDGIKFENVSFNYPGHSETVLSGVDLFLPRGTTLALVGSSGSGKSTLADLVPRFYDPVGGRVLVDGRDLREYDLKSLRRAMGIVSQETYLFNDSVRNNIAYARENAKDEDIIAAAKRANAYEFIIQLPQGFDTNIGDRGVMLSGGQRQRLAIARALLHNPEILILDEATSALDTVSERLVQQAIEELSRDRTTLVIAHRLSTIQNADRIAVLDKGKVVEIGTHDSLLAQGGMYSRLYEVQFSIESKDAIQRARNETLMNTSYEVRTRLNPMLGFLNLLVDDVVDSAEERRELTQEAHDAAIRLLKTLQYLEESGKAGVKPEEADENANAIASSNEQ